MVSQHSYESRFSPVDVKVKYVIHGTDNNITRSLSRCVKRFSLFDKFFAQSLLLITGTMPKLFKTIPSRLGDDFL